VICSLLSPVRVPFAGRGLCTTSSAALQCTGAVCASWCSGHRVQRRELTWILLMSVCLSAYLPACADPSCPNAADVQVATVDSYQVHCTEAPAMPAVCSNCNTRRVTSTAQVHQSRLCLVVNRQSDALASAYLRNPWFLSVQPAERGTRLSSPGYNCSPLSDETD
jgi:hypothetical protein